MLLLDTHTLLWFLHGDERLPSHTNMVICDEDNVAVSIVSLWEIAIKKALGKLVIPEDVKDIAAACAEQAIDILPISIFALDELSRLPMMHGDPFDRLLVATAAAGQMTLVTGDAKISQYSIKTLW